MHWLAAWDGHHYGGQLIIVADADPHPATMKAR
jgi:hypothetical protein